MAGPSTPGRRRTGPAPVAPGNSQAGPPHPAGTAPWPPGGAATEGTHSCRPPGEAQKRGPDAGSTYPPGGGCRSTDFPCTVWPGAFSRPGKFGKPSAPSPEPPERAEKSPPPRPSWARTGIAYSRFYEPETRSVRCSSECPRENPWSLVKIHETWYLHSALLPGLSTYFPMWIIVFFAGKSKPFFCTGVLFICGQM